jgi:tetratricopeptide (TPR) repeat protein
MSDEAQRAVDANPESAAAWHQLGLARQNLARHGDAVQAFTKAASLDRGVARYHHDLGNALIDDGKLDRAITAYRRALRIDDSLAEAHNDLGTAYYEKGWHSEAEGCFRKAISLQPDHGIAHANLGAALRAQGRLGEGRHEFQRALMLKLRALLPEFLRWKVGGPASVTPTASSAASSGLEQALNDLSVALLGRKLEEARTLSARAEKSFPNHPDVLYLASTVREELNEAGAALACIDAAIGLKPERAEYHVARARLLTGAGKLEEALQAAERALTLDPGSAEVHAVLAAVHRGALRLDLAEQSGRKAIELDPRSHAGHSNLSAALWGQGRLEEAETYAREALRLSPRGIHYPMNLAVILKDAGKLDEARRLYREAIGKTPDHPGLLLNMGSLALQCDADLDAARGWYAKCHALGDDPRALLSESIVDLLDTRHDEAWPKYEARKRVAGHLERHAPFSAIPAWSGEPLTEERLLVYGEQGLGDEIMFSSMFADLQQRAARITLLCDARLQVLFARSYPKFGIVPVPSGSKPEIGPMPDCAVAAGSLGIHFRRKAADFPAHRGYLVPDAAKAGDWRARLEALGPGRKIGISWAGGTFSTGQALRSLALERLRPLLETPGAIWVSLQYGDHAREIADFAGSSGIPVHAFPGVTDDMDDLANLVEALDLVVSVCNTTVHVAGAIGKEVLVMAPFLPEWRYGMRGERMLWYPSAQVIRQPAPGAWDDVVSRVKAKLSGA